MASPQDIAVAARKAGNKALVTGDAAKAIEEYTAGLEAVPDDYLLLGNRSEAYLSLKQPEQALADAEAAIAKSNGGWPKGYLRKANAEVALGRTKEAISTLYLGLRSLPPSEPRQAWIDRLAAVKKLHFKVSIEYTPDFGKVLVAKEDVGIGETVFTENPLFWWERSDPQGDVRESDKPDRQSAPIPPKPSPEDLRQAGVTEAFANEPEGADSTAKDNTEEIRPTELGERIAECCRRHGLHHGYALLLEPFMKLSPEEQTAVMKCCCPSVPLSPISVTLTNVAYDISKLPGVDMPQDKVLRLLIVNKVNSHRVFTNHAGIYEVASKMAHSCAPNCLYNGDQCKFVAVAPIRKGGMVTFSYFSSLFLVHSSEVRQTVLRQSHLFVCKCERCVGVDYTRGIRCSCGKGGISDTGADDAVRFRRGTLLLDAERGARGAKSWFCKACDGSWSDDEMAKERSRENDIEAKVQALDGLRDKTEKGQYEKLKEQMERCLQYLSRDHWCYLRLCYLLSNYHLQLARQSSKKSGLELLQLTVMWGRKYADGLRRTKVAEFVPMVFAEWQYWLSRVCGDWPHLMQAKVEFLEAAYATYSKIYPEDPATLRMGTTLERSKRNMETCSNKVFLGKAYRSVTYDFDESELFEKWEKHLTDRYIDAARKSSQNPMKAILHEGTLPVDAIKPAQ